jgi:hypothetical protein
MAEALIGVRAGQVLSREILLNFRVSTLWDSTEGNIRHFVTREMQGPCAVEDLVHVRKHLTREPGDPISGLDEGHQGLP